MIRCHLSRILGEKRLKIADISQDTGINRVDAQMIEHQKRALKIIQLLGIDFKKESDRYGRVLFNTNKKKDFELKDV